MAKIEIRKQLLLTNEEIETLRKAKNIFLEMDKEDYCGEIFCQADNYETEWAWLINFVDYLIDNNEVYEKNV